MDEPDDELPVATLRPRTVSGRVATSRGALARWVRAQGRSTVAVRVALLAVVVAAFVGMGWLMQWLAGLF